MADERTCTEAGTSIRQQQSSCDSGGESHSRCRNLIQLCRSSSDQHNYNTVEDRHIQSFTNNTNMQYFSMSSSSSTTACSCSSCSDVTTWPPRFYPCSFCRRQFTSAQALGGHMNVHRRDRARLTNLPLPYVCYSTNISKGSTTMLAAAAAAAASPSSTMNDLHHQYDQLWSLAGLDDVIQPATPHRLTHNSTPNLIKADEDHSLDLELRLGI